MGSRISSTEKGVLWIRGNLAAFGCISACCTATEKQAAVWPAEAPLGFIYTASAHDCKFTCHSKSYPNEAMHLAGTIAASSFPAQTRRHAPAQWDPCADTMCASAGGTLSQLFIAGHLVKMCPLSFLPCFLLWLDLSLFANVRFYAGRTRERRL